MTIAFTKTCEQLRGERHESAHGQQFHYIDQDLDGFVFRDTRVRFLDTK
jgi:hypothetical protein